MRKCYTITEFATSARYNLDASTSRQAKDLYTESTLFDLKMRQEYVTHDRECVPFIPRNGFGGPQRAAPITLFQLAEFKFTHISPCINKHPGIFTYPQ